MKINLRKLRLKSGITIEELSKRSHVGTGTISRIENHETQPTVSTICKLCVTLNVTIEEMVECRGGLL